MKRYASFRTLKKAADTAQTPAEVQPRGAETVVAFLNLVKQSIKPAQQPPAKSDD